MKRKQYSNEFRAEAVRLAQKGDATPAQVGIDLGLAPGLIYKWIAKFGTRPDGTSVSPDEHDELIRLRRELRLITEERDILKKAIGIFSKELP